MKILKQSSSELVLQHAPVFNWIAYLCGIIVCLVTMPIIPRANPEVGWLGCVPSLIALLMIIASSETNRIITWNFNKPEDIFEVNSKGFFSTKTCTYSLSEIRNLEIDKTPGELFVKIELVLSRNQRLYLDALIESVAKQEMNRIYSFLELPE